MTSGPDPDQRLHRLAEGLGRGFPGLVGLQAEHIAEGRACLAVEIGPQHMAPNGRAHGAALVALADTACGYGCLAGLGEGRSFATIGLTASFTGACRGGRVSCEAVRVHAGSTTEVWDATVTDARGRALAMVRCTQILLEEDR